jgi:hypothetical protein
MDLNQVRNITLLELHCLLSNIWFAATSEVQPYKFIHNGITYVLVDTPGFNDTNESDEDIMNRILVWLEASFRRGTRLNGIVYLHRIIDPKLQGSALQNARMFRQLCGPDCFKNIFLGTTFWESVPPGVGEQREQELKMNFEFWGAMIKKGSQVVRLENNREDGLRILEQIARKDKITLQSQQELVMEKKSYQETAAAKVMNEAFLKQKQELDRKLAEEQRRNQLQVERADCLRRERVAQERERLRRQDEERERRRILAEEREWKAEQEATRARLETERNRQAELQRAQERINQAKREQQAEQARQRARIMKEKRAYYRNYQCAWYQIKARNCSNCCTYVKKGSNLYRKLIAILDLANC